MTPALGWNFQWLHLLCTVYVRRRYRMKKNEPKCHECNNPHFSLIIMHTFSAGGFGTKAVWVTALHWPIRPADCQLYWLAAVAIRSRVLVQRTFLPPSLAWLGLIKAFCWNKVIIHLAISQFPHNYPPASQTLTRMNTSAPAHIRTEAQTQTHFLSDLCHYWEESG